MQAPLKRRRSRAWKLPENLSTTKHAASCGCGVKTVAHYLRCACTCRAMRKALSLVQQARCGNTARSSFGTRACATAGIYRRLPRRLLRRATGHSAPANGRRRRWRYSVWADYWKRPRRYAANKAAVREAAVPTEYQNIVARPVLRSCQSFACTGAASVTARCAAGCGSLPS